MTIEILNKNGQVINVLTAEQWIDSFDNGTYMDLIDGTIDIETSVQKYNQDQECGLNLYRARVVY